MKLNFMLCLFIITLILPTVYSIYLANNHKEKWKNLSHRDKVFAIVGSLASIFLAIFSLFTYLQDQRQELINARHGSFAAPKEPARKSPVIMFGRSRINNVKYPIVYANDEKPIYAWVEDNKLMVNLFIRDSKGNPVAKILHRDWEPIAVEGIDYNNDDTAFEVVTSDDKVICQIEYLRDTIYFVGLLCSEGKRCTFIASNGNISISISSNNGFRFDIPNGLIEPMFKYPRWKYIGERVSKQ